MIQESTRSLQQREKIFLTAGPLFWKKGYVATSIDDIAKAAKINKASIYYYFKNKAAILYGLALKTIQALIDQALPVLNSQLRPEEKLNAFITNHIEFELAHLGLSGIGQMERRNLPGKLREAYTNMRDEYEGIFRKILEEGVEQKRFRCTNGKLTSLFILGFLNSIVQWFRTTGKLSSAEVASAAYTFISYALNSEIGQTCGSNSRLLTKVEKMRKRRNKIR